MLDPEFPQLFLRNAVGAETAGSPFVGGLIRQMHADIAAGGPITRLLEGWKARDGDAMPVRIAGAIRYAGLSGRDPALARAYPDGAEPKTPEAIWPIARAFLEREHNLVADFIKSPPQTNETGRTIGLLLGFATIARQFGLPLQTLEIGASAGLNLNWDSFSYHTPTWSLGDGPVRIEADWQGRPLEATEMPTVVARAGCDLNPLNIDDADTLLRLRSYIWADQSERLRRFDQAVALARKLKVKVDKEGADSWLPRKLAERRPGACTVVYHSLFFLYPPPEVRNAIRAAIESAGAQASAASPLAWLRYEPEGVLGNKPLIPRQILDVVTWPGGGHRILAEVDNTGRWVKRLD